jgi:hypothetical protein
MPNGKPTATTWSPGAGRRWSAWWRRIRSSGILCACSTARSFSGCAPVMEASASSPSAKHLDAVGALHHVQVGQDGALVDDHHAGAHAALDVLFALLAGAVARHAHHGRSDHLGGTRSGRGQGCLLQGAEHGGVDVLLRQRPRAGAQCLGQGEQQQEGQHADGDPQAARTAEEGRGALPPGAGGRVGHGHGPGFGLAGGRRRSRTRAGCRSAVESGFSHPLTCPRERWSRHVSTVAAFVQASGIIAP